MRGRVLGPLAVACIALQFGGSLALSSVSLGLWLAGLAWAAPRPLRRLWMPRFWVVSLVMALGSGLLLGKKDLQLGPLEFSRTGLEAGALMIVRGGFLFGLSSWASTRVVDEDVQRWIARLGLAQFGRALGAAFDLIPTLSGRVRPVLAVGQGSGARARLGALHAGAVGLLVHAVRVAEGQARGAPFIAAVTGPPGSGKTSRVHEIVERLRGRGLVVGGVTQPAVHEGGARVGYRLRDVATGEEVPFARRGEEGFAFTDEGWGWAKARLSTALDAADCVALDEVGRLEARGEGHLAGFSPPPGRTLLLAVRADCAGDIRQRLGAFDLVLPAGAAPAEVDRFTSALEAHLRRFQIQNPQPSRGDER